MSPNGTDSNDSTDNQESDVGTERKKEGDETVSLPNHQQGEAPTPPSNVEAPKSSDQDVERPLFNGVEMTIGSYPRNISDAKVTMMKMWDNLKKIMGFRSSGFAPECKNGGYKDLRGDCICPRYYEGNQCERIICANRGTRTADEKCKCPYPDYINGRHCEFIHCANGGRDMGNGTCQCIDPNWYTGQFCQHYTTSWLAAAGVPLLCIAIVIICCVVCRMDLCPRRGRSNRGRRSNARRHHRQPPPANGHTQPRSSNGRAPSRPRERASRGQELVVQENMLNDQLMRYLNEGRQCMARLEPRPQSVLDPMIGHPPPLESEPKPWDNASEPPPTYEQAMQHVTPRRVPSPLVLPATRPPDYSPSPSALAEDRQLPTNHDNPNNG